MYIESDFTISIIVAKKIMPMMKQMYKLRRVRFLVNFFEAFFIQMSGNQGISSDTAKMTVAVSITVTVAVVTTKPTVLFKYIIIVLVSDRLFPNRILNSKLMVYLHWDHNE